MKMQKMKVVKPPKRGRARTGAAGGNKMRQKMKLGPVKMQSKGKRNSPSAQGKTRSKKPARKMIAKEPLRKMAMKMNRGRKTSPTPSTSRTQVKKKMLKMTTRRAPQPMGRRKGTGKKSAKPAGPKMAMKRCPSADVTKMKKMAAPRSVMKSTNKMVSEASAVARQAMKKATTAVGTRAARSKMAAAKPSEATAQATGRKMMASPARKENGPARKGSGTAKERQRQRAANAMKKMSGAGRKMSTTNIASSSFESTGARDLVGGSNGLTVDLPGMGLTEDDELEAPRNGSEKAEVIDPVREDSSSVIEKSHTADSAPSTPALRDTLQSSAATTSVRHSWDEPVAAASSADEAPTDSNQAEPENHASPSIISASNSDQVCETTVPDRAPAAASTQVATNYHVGGAPSSSASAYGGSHSAAASNIEANNGASYYDSCLPASAGFMTDYRTKCTITGCFNKYKSSTINGVCNKTPRNNAYFSLILDE